MDGEHITIQAVDTILRFILTEPMTLDETLKFFQDGGYIINDWDETTVVIALIGGEGRDYVKLPNGTYKLK